MRGGEIADFALHRETSLRIEVSPLLQFVAFPAPSTGQVVSF
jgi:hypothetical protein